jgi:hypothetical protein
MNKITAAAGACAWLAFGWGTVWAEVSPADNLTIGGRLKQGVAIAYDSDTTGGGPALGQMAYLAELDSAWRPTSNITLTGDFWLRGDWYAGSGSDLLEPGPMNYAASQFLGRFQYHFNGGPRALPAGALVATPPAAPFGTGDRQNQVLDDFNSEVIRELALKVTDPQNRYALKIGKFVRAWGQADGIRLLDVLQAQDYRQKFIFGDADETRIPSWMAAADLQLNRLGVGLPLEALGLKDPRLELIYMPEYHHNRFVINNPTPGDATSGGLYGVPFPALIDDVSGYGIPFIGADLRDREKDRFNFGDPTLGARLKFNALGGEGTLNALYGFQEMPIVKMTGSNLIVGNAFGDVSQALAIVPLTIAQTEFAVHGAYLPYLRSGAATAVGIQNNVFGAIPGSPCNAAGPACSVNVQFDLDYTYRRKLVGASYTRDMVEWQLGPKSVSPVFRTEFSYEFDKPFNRSRVVTVADPATFGIPAPAAVGSATGSGALIVDPSRGIARKYQISLMLGADYFLWLPFWANQDSSILTSLQVFTVATPHGKDLLFQSPYAAYGSQVHEVQNYLTLLLDHTFDHGKLGFNTLLVGDPQNHGWAIRQRFDFNYLGDHLRPRIELIHFGAQAEKGVLGFMDHADNVELSLAYQF